MPLGGIRRSSRLSAKDRASASSALHSLGSATENAAHSRKVRPLGAKGKAWPAAINSLTRRAGELDNEVPGYSLDAGEERAVGA